MDDLISRAAALNAIDCWHIDFNSMDGAKVQTECWRTIKELPAVDAAPVVHAAWMGKETSTAYDLYGVKTWAVKYKCSKCGFTHRAIEAHIYYSYCPSCGARMDGGADER